MDDTGLVTGLTLGEATIRATAEGVSDEARITVTPVPVDKVLVEPAEETLEVNATRQFTATTLDGDGNPLDGRPVTWSSSDDDIATVDGGGLVRAVARDEAIIRATSEGVSALANLTVVRRAVETVVVEPTTATIDVGEDQRFTATALDSDGNMLDCRPVTWASSNTESWRRP